MKMRGKSRPGVIVQQFFHALNTALNNNNYKGTDLNMILPITYGRNYIQPEGDPMYNPLYERELLNLTQDNEATSIRKLDKSKKISVDNLNLDLFLC